MAKKKKKKVVEESEVEPIYGELYPSVSIKKAKGGGFIISYYKRKQGHVEEISETEAGAIKKLKKALD